MISNWYLYLLIHSLGQASTNINFILLWHNIENLRKINIISHSMDNGNVVD